MNNRYAFAGLDFEWENHATTNPLLDRDGFDTSEFDVVIVGGGPSGLGLATALDSSGVRVLVLEADKTVCDSSRATGITQRSFELFDRWAPGVGEDLYKRSIPTLGSESFIGSVPILRQEPADAESTSSRFNPNNYLPQWEIEHELSSRLMESDRSVVRWGNELVSFVEREDHVELVIQAGEQVYRVKAPWLVGADGGKSVVRRQLGVRMKGLSYETTFLIADALVGGTQPEPVRRVWFDPPYLPGGLLLRHMSPGGLWRLDFQLPYGADPDVDGSESNLEELIQAHLKHIGHDSDDVRLVWRGSYKARALTLDQYQFGRVLLVGDAAHLVPIFGGFGLNSAMEDVDNLQWKLGGVVRGTLPEAILGSFSVERPYAVRQMLDLVVRAAELMSPTSERSEDLRKAVLSLASEGNTLARSLSRHRPARPLRLPDSTAVLGSGRRANMEGLGDLVVGEVVPRGTLELDHGNFHTHSSAGNTFVALVSTDGECKECADLQGTLKEILADEIAIVAASLKVSAESEVLGDHTLCLIRPDRVVMGIFDAHAHESISEGLNLFSRKGDREYA